MSQISSRRGKRAWPGWQISVLSVFVVVAVAVRVPALLPGHPLTMDETFTWSASRWPVPRIWSWTQPVDPYHPPLYYTLMHAWTGLAGTSEAALRLPSVFFGAATVPLTYALGHAVRRPIVGLTAAGLLTVWPSHVLYSQMARPYALMGFLVAVAALALFRILTVGQKRIRVPASTADGLQPRSLVPSAITYVAATGAVLLVHNASALALLALWLVFGHGWLTAVPSHRDDAVLRGWLIAQVVVVLIWMSWLPVLVNQFTRAQTSFWLSDLSVDHVSRVIRQLYAPQPPGIPVPWILVVAATALGTYVWVRHLHRREGWWLVILFLTAPVGLLVLSLRQSIFLPHPLVWTVVPLMLIIGAVVWLGRRSIAVAVLGFLAGMAVFALPTTGVPADVRWDVIAKDLAENVREDDVLVFYSPNTETPVRYYLGETVKAPSVRVGEPTPDLAKLTSNAHDRLFLVYADTATWDPDGVLPAYMTRIGRMVARRDVGGAEVIVYDIALSATSSQGKGESSPAD